METVCWNIAYSWLRLLNRTGHDHSGCSPSQDIHSRSTSWLSVSILILSIYSTIFSGIWFFIGVIRPRFRIIRTGGSLNPSTASIIFAIFAKTIELSFVTVFVTFLGQVLSRRSLVKTSSGITVAELTMRTWVSFSSIQAIPQSRIRLNFVLYLECVSNPVAMSRSSNPDS
jgi:hypothetical protein